MPDVKTLYDEDFVAWSKQQAEALRSAARGGSNQQLDWENLVEEVESLGKSERRELRSRLAVIIEHLVKLEHSPARDPRDEWESTVQRERMDIERLLEDSPSLAREVPDMIQKEIRHGVDNAASARARRREFSEPLQRAVQARAYLDLFAYTAEQILGDWFPPEPKS